MKKSNKIVTNFQDPKANQYEQFPFNEIKTCRIFTVTVNF